MEPIQDGFHHSQPPPSTAFRSVERSRAAQSRPENGNLRDCRGHRIRRIENILGLGQQDTGSHRVAKQMENHRVCASKDEREDFRTFPPRSEEHTSELQSRQYLVCRLLLEKKKKYTTVFYDLLFTC